MSGRLLAIGDIHGCRDSLLKLLDRFRIDRRDTLVCIGDYLDRGPDPRGVVETLLALQKTHPNLICLLGNHEAMFLDYYGSGKDEERFFVNGGLATLHSYGLTPADARAGVGFPEEHLVFLSSLPLFHETPDYLFVHGGVRPGIPLADQTPRDLLWIRHEFIDADRPFGKTVVFGHTPQREPLLAADKIGIDTGAVYGGCLTGIDLPSRQLFQVSEGDTARYAGIY
ncbi:MAG: metallophosphoesterase family protein [Deltaproteobacteria bacterium]|nr:metallophosphoesterase family protein [Deltaproteobacteria bacterium]